MKPINNRISLGNIQDLLTPTEDREYYLGSTIEIIDDEDQVVATYEYVKSHAALTQYQPYVIDFGSTAGAEVVTVAPGTLAAPGRKGCVPQVAFTSGYYGWVLTGGNGKAIIDSNPHAVGDHLEILNTGTALVVDGTSGSTAYSVKSRAICKEAGTTAVARDVFLINEKAVIAAT